MTVRASAGRLIEETWKVERTRKKNTFEETEKKAGQQETGLPDQISNQESRVADEQFHVVLRTSATNRRSSNE